MSILHEAKHNKEEMSEKGQQQGAILRKKVRKTERNIGDGQVANSRSEQLLRI